MQQCPHMNSCHGVYIVIWNLQPLTGSRDILSVPESWPNDSRRALNQYLGHSPLPYYRPLVTIADVIVRIIQFIPR